MLYPSSPEVCHDYAAQVTQLKSAGTPVGANELWIACHALAENAALVTHNRREFNREMRLRAETWVAK